MPKTHYMQTAFVAGVLDPRLSARTDIRQYYQGMSVGTNVVPVPLGGVKRRPGQKFVDELPYTLTARHTGATATAPNGGTANNAKDDDLDTVVLTTGNLSTTSPYVVIHYDLGSAIAIRAWDVLGLSITAGSAEDLFAVQYSMDNVAWANAPDTASNIHLIDTIERGWRARLPATITARYWRVARITGVVDLGTAKVQLGDFLLWSETTTVSAVRLAPFVVSTDDAYLAALTERSISLYDTDTDAVDGYAPSPFPTADISLVDYAQAAESMVLVHEDYQPRLLVRDSGNGIWSTERITFSNIPEFDFADVDSPAVTADIQTLTFSSFAQGDTFQLELAGARSGIVVYQGAANTDQEEATAENIRRALQNLYTTGVSGVAVVFTSGTTWTVTFTEDSADNLQLMSGTPLTAASGSAAIAAAKTQDGVSRREPVWSDARGWPRTVTFHEGRLWFGGSKSLPQSVFASVVNDFFNFDLGAGLDDDAIFITLNTYQLNKINGIFSGRDLQLFTSGGEFRFITSPITPANANPKNQTAYGAKQIKPVSTDGATVFVQKTGKVLRDFLFRYEEDAYSSVPLSVLAAHLVSGVVDMTSWQGDASDDANLVLLVNGDGTIAAHVTLRSQEIAAWASWTTDGLYKAVAAAETERYCAVSRTINSQTRIYLEHFVDSYRLDAATAYDGSETSSLDSLEHLALEECRVRSGNLILDNVTVTAGGESDITADGLEYAATEFEVGLEWVPTVTTMPLNTDFGNGDNFLRKKKVVKVRVDVYQSLGLTLNDRPLTDDYWDLQNFDEAPEPFTGVRSLEESSNWDEGPLTQTLSQPDPLPMHIRALEIVLETS